MCEKVRNVKNNVIGSLPYRIRQELEFEVESYGYDVVINYALKNTHSDIKYLTTCMTKARGKFLGYMGKRLQRYKVIEEDPLYDPKESSPEYSNMLDRLYLASIRMDKIDKERIYWIVVMVVRGSHSPMQDAADEIGSNRMSMNRTLRKWKENYAKEINHEVRQVRSLKHLQKLLYWGRRQ